MIETTSARPQSTSWPAADVESLPAILADCRATLDSGLSVAAWDHSVMAICFWAELTAAGKPVSIEALEDLLNIQKAVAGAACGPAGSDMASESDPLGEPP